jgi:hypothetical protein
VPYYFFLVFFRELATGQVPSLALGPVPFLGPNPRPLPAFLPLLLAIFEFALRLFVAISKFFSLYLTMNKIRTFIQVKQISYD